MNIEKMLTAEMPDSMVGKVVTSFDTQVSDPDVNVASYGLTKQLNDNLTAENSEIFQFAYDFDVDDYGFMINGQFIRFGGNKPVFKYLFSFITGTPSGILLDFENNAITNWYGSAWLPTNSYFTVSYNSSQPTNITITAVKALSIHYLNSNMSNSTVSFSNFIDATLAVGESITLNASSGQLAYMLVDMINE